MNDKNMQTMIQKTRFHLHCNIKMQHPETASFSSLLDVKFETNSPCRVSTGLDACDVLGDWITVSATVY